MLFYTNLFIPDKFAGYTFGFIILIRPKYKSDVGLLEHEKVHVKQFWSSFGFMSLLYLNHNYRLKYEVEAYHKQLGFYQEDKTDLFAEFLSTKYNLKITKEEAIKLLKGSEV